MMVVYFFRFLNLFLLVTASVVAFRHWLLAAIRQRMADEKQRMRELRDRARELHNAVKRQQRQLSNDDTQARQLKRRAVLWRKVVEAQRREWEAEQQAYEQEMRARMEKQRAARLYVSVKQEVVPQALVRVRADLVTQYAAGDACAAYQREALARMNDRADEV